MLGRSPSGSSKGGLSSFVQDSLHSAAVAGNYLGKPPSKSNSTYTMPHPTDPSLKSTIGEGISLPFSHLSKQSTAAVTDHHNRSSKSPHRGGMNSTTMTAEIIPLRGC